MKLPAYLKHSSQTVIEKEMFVFCKPLNYYWAHLLYQLSLTLIQQNTA